MLKPTPERIAIHDASAFTAMRRAGRLAAGVSGRRRAGGGSRCSHGEHRPILRDIHS